MFFRRLSTFLLFLILVLGVCFFFNKTIVNKLFEEEAKLPQKVKWLAIGDSHITNSINPKNYPWIANRSHSGEKLLYNYEKIKFYIDNNPQIELVILGYWYASLLYDKDWVLHGKDAVYRYESYLPLMFLNETNVDYLNVLENKALFRENYYGFKYGYPSPSVKLAVKNYLTFNNDLEMKGGFRKAKLEYLPKKSILKKDSTRLIISDIALSNLKDIVDYLKRNKIKLVMYNTPVRNEFLEPLNEENIKLTNSIAMSYVDNKDVWYIDHTKYNIPDNFFNDKHHLNIKGANHMTPIVVDSILKLTSFKNEVK